jgi:hypothetical protein
LNRNHILSAAMGSARPGGAAGVNSWSRLGPIQITGA